VSSRTVLKLVQIRPFGACGVIWNPKQAAKYLPPISFETPATDKNAPSLQSHFQIPLTEEFMREKLNEESPHNTITRSTYNMYGDISDNMKRAAAASVISLYKVVGYPDGQIPKPLSWEKFTSTYSHIRRIVGWEFNTQTLSFSLPSNKRTAITGLLAKWLTKTQFTILEAAKLHGKLADASCENRKGHTMFFAFQNGI
jgi:hypothetical protein